MSDQAAANKLKVGVAGCGAIAVDKHLPGLQKLDTVEIMAFFDRHPERAEAARQKFGAPGARVFGSYAEMLAEGGLDVVHICTGNKSHAEMAIAALEAGLHVMCEKPMAATAAEARQMVAASRRTGKKLSVAYQNRFRPDSLALHEICKNGELGEIYLAKAHAVRRRAVPTWGSFLNRETQGGGPLIDIGTHALDLALWMMGSVRPRYVVGSVYQKLGREGSRANIWGPWDGQKYQVEDSAFGFIMMQNGATLLLESSWALNTLDVKEAKVTLCGTQAGADMDDGLRINGEKYGQLYTQRVEPAISLYKPQLSPFAKSPGDVEAEVWIDHILHGNDLAVTPEQALAVAEIIEAIYASAESGKPVYF